MTLAERKTALEAAIGVLILEFQESTGLTVDQITGGGVNPSIPRVNGVAVPQVIVIARLK